jgi:hypothetical protein
VQVLANDAVVTWKCSPVDIRYRISIRFAELELKDVDRPGYLFTDLLEAGHVLHLAPV